MGVFGAAEAWPGVRVLHGIGVKWRQVNAAAGSAGHTQRVYWAVSGVLTPTPEVSAVLKRARRPRLSANLHRSGHYVVGQDSPFLYLRVLRALRGER